MTAPEQLRGRRLFEEDRHQVVGSEDRLLEVLICLELLGHDVVSLCLSAIDAATMTLVRRCVVEMTRDGRAESITVGLSREHASG